MTETKDYFLRRLRVSVKGKKKKEKKRRKKKKKEEGICRIALRKLQLWRTFSPAPAKWI